MRIVTLLMLLACCAPLVAEEHVEYAKPELLVEPRELVEYAFGRDTGFSEAGVAILDLRSEEDLDGIGLRDAKHIDITEWKRAFGHGDDADGWTARIDQVVHHPDATVVVVDDGVTPSAARAWWILKYWGLNDVRIFNANGEQAKKTALGMTVSSLMVQPSKAEFAAKPHPNRLATADEVLGITRGGDACLIDTRSDRENHAGFIPTASHSDWTAYVDQETGKIRSPEELQKLLDAVGFDKDGRNIAYCQSGGRASVVAFAMELMGGSQVENYFGSWGEWSRLPNAPIAKP